MARVFISKPVTLLQVFRADASQRRRGCTRPLQRDIIAMPFILPWGQALETLSLSVFVHLWLHHHISASQVTPFRFVPDQYASVRYCWRINLLGMMPEIRRMIQETPRLGRYLPTQRPSKARNISIWTFSKCDSVFGQMAHLFRPTIAL